MKILTRFALGGLHGSSLFISGGSLGLIRSIHDLVPGCGGQGQPRDPSDAPATAAAMDPSWVLLNDRGCRRDNSTTVAHDTKTMAECRLSTGRQRLRVSFRPAAPPASSFLYYDSVGIVDVDAIAAHGDSILLRGRRHRNLYHYLVYRAGTALRPPSLSLLPTLTIPRKYDTHRVLLTDDTGVLRRGEDELVVAQLHSGHHDEPDMADLCVLRFGRGQPPRWELKGPLPVVHEQGDELKGLSWGSDMAIPVGDRFLCWVSYGSSFVLCDMAEEASPKLRNVPLPVHYDPSYYTNDLLPLNDSEGMGAAGHGAVRFVAVKPRCCCGRFGRTSCAHSRFAFTVTTWTLTLTMDEPMAWVKDGVLDCEELWATPGYEGLPRVHLESPVVSLDNPDVVCFKVGSDRRVGGKAWMIQVDMRRKTLLGAVSWTSDTARAQLRLPARL